MAAKSKVVSVRVAPELAADLDRHGENLNLRLLLEDAIRSAVALMDSQTGSTAKWHELGIGTRVWLLLKDQPAYKGVRQWLTAQQIALLLLTRHPELLENVDWSIGGEGSGNFNWATFIGARLTEAVDKGTLPNIERSYLSNEHLSSLVYTGVQGSSHLISSVPGQDYPHALFRWNG